MSIISLEPIYPSRQAQIALLKADEATTAIISKYVDFVDVFFLDLIANLPEHTKINEHTIKLIDIK